MNRICLVFGLGLLTAATARAGSGPFFDTYSHGMEVGELELELGVDAVRSPRGEWTYGQVAELERGFDPHFASALYLLGTWAPGESPRIDGFKLQGRFRPWLANNFFLPVFYLEYEQFHHPETYRELVVGTLEEEEAGEFATEHELEGRLIFSQDFDWGNLSLDLAAEKNLDGGEIAVGYTVGFFLLGPNRIYSGAAAFDPDGDGDSHLLYGVELFGGLGERGDLGLHAARQEHYLQPFLAVPLSDRLALKAALAIGLTSGSGDLVRALLVVRLGRAL
ncbi:MAG: hypothetical protein U0X73_02150 [Thermoanaerobaculia bacterium]